VIARAIAGKGRGEHPPCRTRTSVLKVMKRLPIRFGMGLASEAPKPAACQQPTGAATTTAVNPEIIPILSGIACSELLLGLPDIA